MSLSVEKLKTKAQGKMHGRTMNKVADVYGKMREAGSNIVARIDPYETIRRVRIENAIFDQVYNYTCPADLKGVDKIIDIRPIGVRSNEDSIRGAYARQFDILKSTDTTTVEMLNGVKTLRLNKDLTSRTVLHRCDSLTLEGTVTAGGDVQDLAINQLEHLSGLGAIQFKLSGASGTGNITLNLNTAVDLSSMENVGALFAWLRFADASRITSVELRFGNSTGDYWSKTITAPHDRSSFESGVFTLGRFDWRDATDSGSPDASDIDYLRVSFTYTTGAALAANFLENITAAKGEAYELVYYSNCLFTDSTGMTWKVEPDNDTDLLVLENTAENIYLYEFQKTLANAVKGKNMGADYQAAELELEGNGRTKPGLYNVYEENYPSLALMQQEEYYQFGTLE